MGTIEHRIGSGEIQPGAVVSEMQPTDFRPAYLDCVNARPMLQFRPSCFTLEDARRSIAAFRTLNSEPIESRVALGAARLDAKAPYWYLVIDLDRLDIMKLRYCVLGQLAGEYLKGLRYLFPELRDYDATENEIVGLAVENGFIPDTKKESDALTSEWKRVIIARIDSSLYYMMTQTVKQALDEWYPMKGSYRSQGALQCEAVSSS